MTAVRWKHSVSILIITGNCAPQDKLDTFNIATFAVRVKRFHLEFAGSDAAVHLTAWDEACGGGMRAHHCRRKYLAQLPRRRDCGIFGMVLAIISLEETYAPITRSTV